MPGDGHCLYHALAWWATTNHIAMRNTIAEAPATLWHHICPWDNGPALRRFRQDTVDTTQWGTALQIAVCAALYQVTIDVSTPFWASHLW